MNQYDHYNEMVNSLYLTCFVFVVDNILDDTGFYLI